ncbi:MAG: hypothetical protein AB2A00_02495 [Myxococcota bacterium]
MVPAWALGLALLAAPPPAPPPKAVPPPSAPRSNDGNIDEMLKTAGEACEALDFDLCIERSNAALSRVDIQDAQRERAYVLVAGAYVVVGQALEAERFYRLLLRLRPDFELPADTPPKILGVFRRVRAEEDQIRNAVKDARRKSLVQSIRMQVDAPQKHQGGQPLTITARVQDPQRGVASLVLEHRVDPNAPFATAPFQGSGETRTVAFTAAQTATDHPLALQYRVVARDEEGNTLTTHEGTQGPLVVDIAPGQVPSDPFYTQRQFWVLAGGAGGAVGVVALVFVTAVLVGGTLGSGGLYLLLRGDGVPETTAGKHRVR